jgi:hypothetical protein
MYCRGSGEAIYLVLFLYVDGHTASTPGGRAWA